MLELILVWFGFGFGVKCSLFLVKNIESIFHNFVLE
jgi:hypothetical protein